MSLPRQLPPDAEGYTKQMVVHFSLAGGGSASYRIFGPGGVTMPITYAYNTADKPPWRGFFLDGQPECLTWRQLVARWPVYLTSRSAAATGLGKAP